STRDLASTAQQTVDFVATPPTEQPVETARIEITDPTTALFPTEPGRFAYVPSGPLSEPAQFQRLRHGLTQLVQGIGALHQAGKLHRDIKPSNVLVAPDERVVLLDFGLVTELAVGAADADSLGEFAGTLHYMSPEQSSGMRLTPASDWYAVGVMLY